MAADGRGPRGSWSRLVLAVLATVASLGGTMMFVTKAVAEREITVISSRALVLGDEGKAITARWARAAQAALWLDPLNQNALNIAYVEAQRRGDDPERMGEFRTRLAAMGWRSTSTQQNLIVAAAERQDFAEVMDRVDGLLRRNKFTTQVDPFMAAVENDPQTRAALVAKLRTAPPWREMLLLRGGELRGSRRLRDRAATMEAILDTGARLRRIEAAPFLTNAVAAGEMAPAYRLWSRTLRQRTAGGLLYDGDFKVAAVQGVRPPLPVPFEWTFENGDGFSTSVGSGGGLFVRWSGRGVPLLLGQPIRTAAAGRGYRLHIETDPPSVPIIADKFTITLSCGSRFTVFKQVARGPRTIDMTADPIACDFAAFSVSGRLQDIAEPMTALITSLRLEAR